MGVVAAPVESARKEGHVYCADDRLYETYIRVYCLIH